MTIQRLPIGLAGGRAGPAEDTAVAVVLWAFGAGMKASTQHFGLMARTAGSPRAGVLFQSVAAKLILLFHVERIALCFT